MPQPHDRLFRFVFGEPDEAAELLRSALPPAVVGAIAWNSLRRINRTFVDEELREHYTDLLFTADLGGRPVLLYALLEHKSSPAPMTPFQLLRYTVRILEQHCRDNPDDDGLPAVLPVVFYHGERPWRGPRRMRRLVRLGSLDRPVAAWLMRLQPDLSFVLQDFSGSSEAELEARALSIVTWFSLRVLLYVRGCGLDEAARVLAGWRETIPRLLAHRRGAEVLGAVYSYMLSTVRCEPQQLDAVAQRLFDPRTTSIMTSAADHLRAQGRAQGHAQGRMEERQNLLLRQLQGRFGPLTDHAIARLRSASPAELEAIVDRVLTAATLAEALGG